LLGGLVAASEEEKKDAALERVVDAVAGTEVDPEFGDAISQVPVGPGVSVNEPIDTNENPRATVFVCESVDLAPELVGLLDPHSPECSV
jgi:hypothetical protein